MDKDANDPTNQNYHLLAGEESSKYPQILRPFALPKFEIDEQLQVNFRFDNLIETEGLFGMPDQDNKWIEDFASRSGAVEFSSSATESCTLPRTNNVWCDVTSSESVELLLKSVGEEEMMHKKEVFIDSSADERPERLVVPADSLLTPDKLPRSDARDISHSGLLHEQFHGCLLPSNVDAAHDEHDSVLNNVIIGRETSPIANFPEGTCQALDGLPDAVRGDMNQESSLNREVAVDNKTYLTDEDRFLLLDGSKNVSLSDMSFVDHGLESVRMKDPLVSQDITEFRRIYTGDSRVLNSDRGREEISDTCTTEGDMGSFSCLGTSLGNIKNSSGGIAVCILSQSSDGLLESITCPKVPNHDMGGPDRKPVVETGDGDDVRLSDSLESLNNVEHYLSTEGSELCNLGGGIGEIPSDTYTGREDAEHYSSIVSSEEPASADEEQVGPLHEAAPGFAEKNVEDGGIKIYTDRSMSKVEASQGVRGEMKTGGSLSFSPGYPASSKENAPDAIMPSGTKSASCGISENTHESSDYEHNNLPITDVCIANNEQDESVEDAEEPPCNLTTAELLHDENAPQVLLVSQEGKPQPAALGARTSDEILDKVDAISYTNVQNELELQQSDAVEGVAADKPSLTTAAVTVVDSSEEFRNKTDVGEDVRHSSAGSGLSSISDTCTVVTEPHGVAKAADVSMVSGHDSENNLFVRGAGSALERIIGSNSGNLSNQLVNPSTETSSHQDEIVLVENPVGDSDGGNSCNQLVYSSTETSSHQDKMVLVENPVGDSDGGNPSNQLVNCSSETPSCQDEMVVKNPVGDSDGGNLRNQLVDCSTEILPCQDEMVLVESQGGNSVDIPGTSSSHAEKHPSVTAANNYKVSVLEVTQATESEMDLSTPDTMTNKSMEPGEKLINHEITMTKASSALVSDTEQRENTSGSCTASADVIENENFHPATVPQSQPLESNTSEILESHNLPDLNASSSTTALTYQPFTDLQHVQLRAQIFVYGSLIQGVPPGEAYMLSAFGESGGRATIWREAWHCAVQRFQSQKSPLSFLQTPTSSQPSHWPAECLTSRAKNKSIGASTGRKGNKNVPMLNSSVLSPPPSTAIASPGPGSISSSIPRSTNSDAGYSLFPSGLPNTRPTSLGLTPWFSQAPYPVSWAVPPQKLIFDPSAQLPSSIAAVETGKATPQKNVFISAKTQMVSPGNLCPTIPGSLIVQSEQQKTPSSPKNSLATPRTRKRKQSSDKEVHKLTPMDTSRTEKLPDSIALPTNHCLTGPGFVFSANPPSKLSLNGTPAASKISSPSSSQLVGSNRFPLLDDIHLSVEQSKLQAEEASVCADVSVKHSQAIWAQLDLKNKSGVPPGVGEKLISAAAAAAAAASVAKAAAEAAKVASEVALQAKIMGEEAISSVDSRNYHAIIDSGQPDPKSSLLNLLSVPALGEKDKTHVSPCILSAFRDAAKKRVEAASAAAKRAENLDAIVKAAELAAEAVSQAGSIIAMGDPLPFTISELLEAGPANYWRSLSAKLAKHSTSDKLLPVETPKELLDERSSVKEQQLNVEVRTTKETHSKGKQPFQSEEICCGNELEEPSVAPNDMSGPNLTNRVANNIQKGTLVEVCVDADSCKGVWLSANVLDTKDNKAFICYNGASVGGEGQHTEWITLECDAHKAPRIRLPHPLSTAKFEGTRKRRRNMETYYWAVGDHVDARFQDGWGEAVIMEKTNVEGTKYMVKFLGGGGDTSIANAWDIRPSLVWRDGQWIQWSRSRQENACPPEGCSPYEKRQRVGPFEFIPDQQGTVTKDGKHLNDVIDKPEETRLLELSVQDVVFNLGKSDADAKASKLKPSGLQKEGPRVVYGVPRPGKKRKFMEVSKHYVEDKNAKGVEANSSLKFTRIPMPPTTRARGTTSKVNQKVVKQTSDVAKGRSVRAIKPENVPVRNIEAGSSGSHVGSISDAGASVDREGWTEKNGANASFQSRIPTDMGTKGKLKNAAGSSNKSEPMAYENVIEPRRSCRRIQPTSRLLEGLQSSFTVPRISSSDKAMRGFQRNTASSRGRTN